MIYISICSLNLTHYFEETILPLLSRMSNLEKLHLCLRIHLSSRYIDTHYLERNLLSRLPRLTGLNFSIDSHVFLSDCQLNLKIFENLENALPSIRHSSFIFYGDYFSKPMQIQYHLFV